jgi:toxin FitB
MNVVDSSGWIEFFTGGPGADFFALPITKIDELLVPSICLYEVYRLILRQQGEGPAETAVAHMRSGRVIDLDSDIAISAAALGHELKLAMADSVILATTRAYDADLWTQDADFAQIPGVHYRKKE